MKLGLGLGALCALGLACAPTALADWPHDVKWDQLDPDPVWTWQSYTNSQADMIVADDFPCSETGWITDIEFDGFCASVTSLSQFRITFYRDVPATPDEESHPGQLIDEIFMSKASASDPLGLGWKLIQEDRFRINLPESDWFFQEQGTVYWIGIQGVLADVGQFSWKFRDRTADTWNDDAVSRGCTEPLDAWLHLGWQQTCCFLVPGPYEGTLPDGFLKSADMSFRLTGIAIPEPAACLLVVVGAALIAARRRRTRT